MIPDHMSESSVEGMLGIGKREHPASDVIPASEMAKTERHLDRIVAGVEKVPGETGWIGSIEYKRVPVDHASFCAKCGDLLGSQYGVVECGSDDGPYYCTPEHLQEAKGTGI